jgi:hypothetical protein
LLPTSGALGLLERTGALLAVPAVLAATGFLGPAERVRLRALLDRGRLRSAEIG